MAEDVPPVMKMTGTIVEKGLDRILVIGKGQEITDSINKSLIILPIAGPMIMIGMIEVTVGKEANQSMNNFNLVNPNTSMKEEKRKSCSKKLDWP